MKKLKQLKQSDLKKVRKFYHRKQNSTCPILNQEFDISDMVVDHKHRKKSVKVGDQNCGLVRGVIQRSANVIEGKISNAYVRYGLHKFNITLPAFLRNMADYIENPPLESKRLIHPSESPKPKKLMKRSYKKLHTLYKKNPTKGKFPPFPKSGKMIKGLEKLYTHYDLKPEFYGVKK